MSALILHTAVALPPYAYSQDELAALIAGWLGPRTELAAKAAAILRNSAVARRHTARPAEWYLAHPSVRERTAEYRAQMAELCTRAAAAALAGADLHAGAIDLLICTSCTGVMIPSVDAVLMNRLPFRATTRRQPLTALGCVAGATAIAQAADFLTAHPDGAALVVSAELASLTAQVEDFSLTNIVAGAIFGDGGAATVLVGRERARTLPAFDREARPVPRVVATRSVLFPDSLELMGFDNTDTGLRIVLSPRVPRFIAQALPPHLDAFLDEQGLTRGDLRHFLLHPGGRKVLDGLQRALGLSAHDLRFSRAVLREQGNLSSATVLFLLERFAREGQPRAGDLGLLMAVGPGFSAELVLLRW